MMRQTLVVGLTAVIASATATEADATAQWYGNGGYNFNPWAHQSHGSGYSSPFGYGGEGKIPKLQRDVSYLVKLEGVNKTRMDAIETAI